MRPHSPPHAAERRARLGPILDKALGDAPGLASAAGKAGQSRSPDRAMEAAEGGTKVWHIELLDSCGGEQELMNPNEPKRPAMAQPIQLVFVLVRPESEERSEELPVGMLKIFVRAEDLPGVLGSEKVAKILARHCLTPVIRSAKRLTLYWLGDVLSVADRLRRGEIVIDFKTQTVAQKSLPHEQS